MSPLVIIVLAESVALVVALYFLMLRAPGATSAPPPRPAMLPPSAEDAAHGEGEAARRNRELAETKAQVTDLREQLKRLKKERFEQRQTEKGGHALVREREHVERAASQQLEAVRAELATALSDGEKLRAELELHRGRRPSAVSVAAAPVAPSPAPAAAPAAAPAPPPAAPREARELNPSELARLERAEQKASKDRARAMELERDLRKVRSKAELNSRLYMVVKGELDLARDKYKALEKRLNRILLEKDLGVRAIRQLERESGKVADRTELTPDEVAASDARTDAAHQAEAAALAAAQPPVAAPEEHPEETSPPPHSA